MIYYANPSTDEIRDAMLRGELGYIATPHQQNIMFADEMDTIADNGCFADRWTHEHWFRWMLGLPRSVRFVVCPDVFDPDGGECHAATLERWEQYAPVIRRHGFTPAFVCQVGCTADNYPDDAEVLFLGGTTEYKLGDHAWAITRRAKSEGRWVHMGRVNSERRFTTARAMGCDSVDGTYLTYGPDTNLPKLLGWVRRAREAPMLFE